MATLFISDLHLSQERPEITDIFLRFLQGPARQAEELYILGDLFEAWLGDDMVLPEYQPAIAELKSLSESVPIYIMYGNRDFLMRDDFETMSGCTLLDEELVIDLYGTPTLLMHGDTLCTDDIAYQDFRKMVRDPAWQDDLLGKTPAERLALAKKLRDISKTETSGKQQAIMDVNLAAVEQAMQKQGVQQLIHGHTHRPAIHEFELAGQPARRIVLTDWYEAGGFLRCDASGCQPEKLD